MEPAIQVPHTLINTVGGVPSREGHIPYFCLSPSLCPFYRQFIQPGSQQPALAWPCCSIGSFTVNSGSYAACQADQHQRQRAHRYEV